MVASPITGCQLVTTVPSKVSPFGWVIFAGWYCTADFCESAGTVAADFL